MQQPEKGAPQPGQGAEARGSDASIVRESRLEKSCRSRLKALGFDAQRQGQDIVITRAGRPICTIPQTLLLDRVRHFERVALGRA